MVSDNLAEASPRPEPESGSAASFPQGQQIDLGHLTGIGSAIAQPLTSLDSASGTRAFLTGIVQSKALRKRLLFFGAPIIFAGVSYLIFHERIEEMPPEFLPVAKDLLINGKADPAEMQKLVQSMVEGKVPVPSNLPGGLQNEIERIKKGEKPSGSALPGPNSQLTPMVRQALGRSRETAGPGTVAISKQSPPAVAAPLKKKKGITTIELPTSPPPQTLPQITVESLKQPTLSAPPTPQAAGMGLGGYATKPTVGDAGEIRNPYRNLPNPAPASDTTGRLWTAKEELVLRSGLTNSSSWIRYQTVLRAHSNKLQGSSVALIEALGDPKLWVRMRALIALVDLGVELTPEAIMKALGNERPGLVARFFKRFHKNSGPTELFVLRECLKYADSRARLAILFALNRASHEDELNHMFLIAGLYDESAQVRTFARSHLPNVQQNKIDKYKQMVVELSALETEAKHEVPAAASPAVPPSPPAANGLEQIEIQKSE